MWWPTENYAPSVHHHKARKEVYKRFWTMMYHRNVWNDPRYVQKKLDALNFDSNRKHHEWVHQRDIMPDCVTSVVRTWYPNPKDMQYMDHKWK